MTKGSRKQNSREGSWLTGMAAYSDIWTEFTKSKRQRSESAFCQDERPSSDLETLLKLVRSGGSNELPWWWKHVQNKQYCSSILHSTTLANTHTAPTHKLRDSQAGRFLNYDYCLDDKSGVHSGKPYTSLNSSLNEGSF